MFTALSRVCFAVSVLKTTIQVGAAGIIVHMIAESVEEGVPPHL